MSARTDILDLARLSLASGEGRRLDVNVALDDFTYGGERYAVTPAAVPVRLDVSRTTGQGYALRLRFAATLSGPCMRCLGEAEPEFTVDAREVHFPHPPGGDELSSPYMDGEELDLSGWAHDALALALPAQLLCRDDCAGLCPVCGEDLNAAGPGHAHDSEPDPRWAKLRELRLD